MRTAAQNRASRSNGACSRGPVTEAGKARSRFGAVRDGLRSKTVVLPGENDQEYQSLLEELIHDLQPRDASEHGLVHNIAVADWFQLRAMRVQHHRLTSCTLAAAARIDAEVAATLDRLFSDSGRPNATYCSSTVACGGTRTSSSENVDDSQKPPALVQRLESTAKGCQALIEQWREIADRVEKNLEIQPHDRLKMIRMLSKQPVDVLVDQRVWLIYVSTFGHYPNGRSEPFEDLKSDFETVELDKFLPRVRSRWGLLLDSSDTARCRDTLLDLVARNVERLEAKREAHLAHLDEQAASTAAQLAFVESPEGGRLTRYEQAAQRRTQRCRDVFWKHRREMGKEENGGRSAEDFCELCEAEKAVDFLPESGVGQEMTNGPAKNLTNEPKGGVSESEADQLKEVAALNKALERANFELSAMRDLGIGASGTRVVGDARGRAAIAASIAKRGPLLPPNS
jgi:hypothetical protein